MKKHPSTLQDWLDWQQTLHPKNIDFKGKRKSDRWKKIEKRSKLRNDTSKQNKDKKNNKSSKKTRVKNKQS